MNISKANRNRRPTQFDVAKLAGVSQTAVSSVLNNSATISIPEETRKRILDAIQDLDYVPDRSARSLRTQKTYTIATIIPDITNPFYPAFIRGIQDVANHNGYDLIIYNTDGVLAEEQKCLSSVKQNQVDGLIVAAFHLEEDELLAINTPIVHVNKTNREAPVLDSIYVDSIAMAHTAVSHLIERGHLRIGMIAGIEDSPPGYNCILGYRRAMAEHNLTVEDAFIHGGQFIEEGGYLAMEKLLEITPRLSAVFAANDLMALGAFMAIREAGLRIPQDIALVGIDDIPAARMVTPALTTINQFQKDIGQRAAEMLFNRFSGMSDGAPYSVEMPFSLIVREST